VRKLREVLHPLVQHGNTVVVIEHDLEVIKGADFLIDPGSEGGDADGRIAATDTPEQVARTRGSYTGACLSRVLAPRLKDKKRRA
jgi:excinuclease ABC subunit A